ncbi:unnamed protein product [Hydatigera taeniaeformis]|uniref:Uncharacterized protein n=1 Tax=Hydatigena taeniaeformis TaxID=6205 RepID=A0A0R3XC38_HYDTA|nr:unnamed protein product [Hydatigera taeniaeformis]
MSFERQASLYIGGGGSKGLTGTNQEENMNANCADRMKEFMKLIFLPPSCCYDLLEVCLISGLDDDHRGAHTALARWSDFQVMLQVVIVFSFGAVPFPTYEGVVVENEREFGSMSSLVATVCDKIGGVMEVCSATRDGRTSSAFTISMFLCHAIHLGNDRTCKSPANASSRCLPHSNIHARRREKRLQFLLHSHGSVLQPSGTSRSFERDQ